MSLDPPSLTALRCFLAVAETGGVRRAAERLNVTESAISHQLRRLEETLGDRLVEKHGRGIRLTRIGGSYARMVAPPMAEIASATALLFERRPPRQVTITLPPTLAIMWLIPRLPLLEAEAPEVSVRLITTAQLLDLVRSDIDLALRYFIAGDGDGELLVDETAFPVCTPAAVPQSDGPRALAHLLRESRLLENDGHPGEWEAWSAAAGGTFPLSSRRARFDDLNMTLEAAAQGYGMAIGRHPMAGDYLARGRLVAPFGTDFPTGACYRLQFAADGHRPRARGLVADFLRRQAAAPG